jgi:hypothetical protein
VQARNGGAIGALNVRLSDLPRGTKPRQHTTQVPTGPGWTGCGQRASKLPIRLLAFDGTVYFSPLPVGGTVLTAYVTAGLSLAGSASDAHRSFLAQRGYLAAQLGRTVPVAGMAVGDEHVALYQPCAAGPQALQGFTILFRRRAYVELLSLVSGCPATASRTVATSLHQETARLAGRVDARLLTR